MKFERYADDIIVHVKTGKTAAFVCDVVRERFGRCKLELNKEKTKTVYCLDRVRKMKNFAGNLTHPHTKFEFLGFEFRQRSVKGETGLFDGFTPGISPNARREIQSTIRTWSIGRKSETSLQDLSRIYNPVLRGWFNYYGAFAKQALKPINHQWNAVLLKWAVRKHKGFRRQKGKAYLWLQKISKEKPELFATWDAFHRTKT